MLIRYIMLFEENPVTILLQLFILLLAAIIILLLYFERSTTSQIRKTVDAIDIPPCPSCPQCPDLNSEGCPDLTCPEMGECPECPKCPDVNTSCPTHKGLTVDDIVEAIFPGRNSGLTTHGNYFPLDGLGEASVEPAYSPVINMMPNYVGGDGVPAAISLSDQKLLNNSSSIRLASQKEPPIMNSQGVFSQNTGAATTSTSTTAAPEAPVTGGPVSDTAATAVTNPPITTTQN